MYFPVAQLYASVDSALKTPRFDVATIHVVGVAADTAGARTMSPAAARCVGQNDAPADLADTLDGPQH